MARRSLNPKNIEMHSKFCKFVVMSSYGEEKVLTKDIGFIIPRCALEVVNYVIAIYDI